MAFADKGNGEPLQFPLSYPLKVIGKNTNEFYAVVRSIIENHLSQAEQVTYHTRTSTGGKYLSVTATFLARSKEHLDTIYQDLNRHELVVMTL